MTVYKVMAARTEREIALIQFGKKVAEERIIKLLKEKARHLEQVSKSIAMDDYMSDEDAAVPENGAFALNEFADALIKGEK